jgi:hypothetical protein
MHEAVTRCKVASKNACYSIITMPPHLQGDLKVLGMVQTHVTHVNSQAARAE